MSTLPRQRGFTLVEAVIVIALSGITLAMVAMFIRQPITAYIDQARRGELSDAADQALRRIARDVQRALPNSVRVDASGQYLEFLPVSAAGRYRAAPDVAGTADHLDFGSSSDNSFAVLGPAVSVASGDQLVIYNLGLSGADAYGSGESRRALTSTGAALSSLTYTLGGAQFPYASPSNRFHVVNSPVSYVCAPVAGGAGTLRRYAGYAIQSAQPVSAAAAPLSSLSGVNNALLSNSVSQCSFGYTAVSMRSAVLTLKLTLTASGESVTLLQQVNLDNSP